jgi:hypothetical protein
MFRQRQPPPSRSRFEPFVILPAGSPVMPEPHEVEVAWILARHYHTVVQFLTPSEGYKMKTADMVMNGVIWEVKSPTGKGRSTVPNQFKRAAKQSSHVVFDARRVRLDESEVLRQVRWNLETRKSLKVVLFITKAGTVVEIQPA